jgi:CheY-like chemotaxis protein
MDEDKKRIVVVEDDPAMQELFRMLLMQGGMHTVEIAGDGHEAITKIAMDKTDLIIMDFMLPDKGGFEIIKQIQDMVDGSPPVIGVTGRYKNSAEEEEIRSQPNVVDFFLKPVDHEEFLLSVRKALGAAD